MILNKKYSIFILVIGIACLINCIGCSKKEKPVKKKQPIKIVDLVTFTLKDGSKIKVDTNQFGLKNLPSCEIVSYENKADNRHLIDDRGNPYTQPVYKHQMLMETTDSIDNLITFFFPTTPHIANRRKPGNVDMYVRLVSTKDIKKIRALEEPYIVIDMRVVYPKPAQPEDDTGDANNQTVRSPGVISSEQDLVSALKSNLQMLNKRQTLDSVSIPEKRRIRGEIEMLERELAKITKRLDDAQKRRERIAQKTKKTQEAQQKIKTAIVKLKVISYNLRSE